MNKTKYGYYVGYDTTKRKKYDDEQRVEIINLKRSGMSIRSIANKLGIPHGSIHYILREYGEINLDISRPGNNYITRAEAKYYYDITDSTFDYYRGKCADKVIKKGNIIYIDRDVFEDYVIDHKGYKGRGWQMTESKVQASILKYLKSVNAYCVKVQMANRSGIPDIIACYKGKFIGIEVKTETTQRNTSKLQEANLKMIVESEGIAIVAWEISQVKEIIGRIDNDTISASN